MDEGVSRRELDHPFLLTVNIVSDDRAKFWSVHIVVKSRLFSHQVVSQGNIYYPIITNTSMSPMCEPGFT